MVNFPAKIGICIAIFITGNPCAAGILPELGRVIVRHNSAFLPNSINFFFGHNQNLSSSIKPYQ